MPRTWRLERCLPPRHAGGQGGGQGARRREDDNRCRRRSLLRPAARKRGRKSSKKGTGSGSLTATFAAAASTGSWSSSSLPARAGCDWKWRTRQPGQSRPCSDENTGRRENLESRKAGKPEHRGFRSCFPAFQIHLSQRADGTLLHWRSATSRRRRLPSAKVSPRALPSPTRRNRARLRKTCPPLLIAPARAPWLVSPSGAR